MCATKPQILTLFDDIGMNVRVYCMKCVVTLIQGMRCGLFFSLWKVESLPVLLHSGQA